MEHRFATSPKGVLMSTPRWSDDENDVVIDAYFQMLTWERIGREFVKADVNRSVQQQLPGRSRGSIEFKFQNISAVLNDAGYDFIDGYKPLANYQDALAERVLKRVG